MTTKSTSTTHVRKRPYQAPITSFFTEKSQSPSTHGSAPIYLPLPVETQTSLLHVGMRVRKSVPEGYKTHKTKHNRGHLPTSTGSVSSQSAATIRIMPSSRELAPFCGMHKIGGLDSGSAGDMPSSSAPAVVEASYGGASWYNQGLAFSQTTLDSFDDSFDEDRNSSCASKTKRTYGEAIEAEMDAFFDETDDDANEIVKFRRFAQPRGTSKRANTSVPIHDTVRINDFEEAPFLYVTDGMEVDEDLDF